MSDCPWPRVTSYGAPPRPPVPGPASGEAQMAGGPQPVPPGGRFRGRWRVWLGPLQGCGAVVVARDPNSSGIGACAGLRWLRQAHVWSASRRGERGQGRSVVGGAAGWAACRSWLGGVLLEPAPWVGPQAVSSPRQARHAPRASRSRVAGPDTVAPIALPPVPGARQPPSPTAHRRWRHPAARMGPTWVVGSVTGTPGHRRRSPATQQGFAGDGE
jgi:hypothetical protein